MDSMGITPSVWFPVVSVVIGFTCKGVLDHLTDRRRITAEGIARREGRSEAARLRRIEFQRSTLIELQELLDELGRYAARASIEDIRAYRHSGIWGKNMLEGSLSEDMRQAQSRAMLLGSRVTSNQMRQGIVQFRGGVSAISLARGEDESNSALYSLMGFAKTLHESIGAELRRLDSDEENILT